MTASTLQHSLKQAFHAALLTAYPDEHQLLTSFQLDIIPSSRPDLGHYQCNSAMKLVPLLKKPAPAIAHAWQQALMHHSDFTVSVAGLGFLNITCTASYLSKCLNQRHNDTRLGVALHARRRVIVDYSSPNIAKEMHVGHLRSTIIGDALARLLSFLGYDVIRLNHIGDWGTQFGMLICHILEIGGDPKTASVATLMSWYQAAKLRFDEDPVFKQQAQACVVDLQNKKPDIFASWQDICAISEQSYALIYHTLGITDLQTRGESFYNSFLVDVIADLTAKDLITRSDDAKCVFLEGFETRNNTPLPLIVQKKDGGYNYATTDLAALKHRCTVEKADWILYVTDSGQQQHFAMVFAAAHKVGYINTTRVDHIPFGLVLKPDGKKFKTRSGDTEKLSDLLAAAIDKARLELQVRQPDLSDSELAAASRTLGIGAIKYADLATNRLNDYVFSYDKMLQFEGNTIAFLLYAYVRAQSILRKTPEAPGEIILTEPTEVALGLHILRFPEALEKMYQDLLPNRLTDYLFRLAEKFHTFFHACRVTGHPHATSRLSLCQQTARTIALGLSLLGIGTLEHM